MRGLARFGPVCLFLLLLLVSGSRPASVHGQGIGAHEPGQIIIKLRPLLGNNINLLNAIYGTVTIEPLLGRRDTFLIRVPPALDATQLVRILANDPLLVYAELNYTQEPPAASTDRIYAWGDTQGTHLHDQNAIADVRLAEAHTLSRGAQTVIAIVDTGIQRDHPALRDHLAPVGYDFVDNDLVPEDAPNGLDEDGDGQVDEAVGHGTHIAGIAHLVAPDARLMPLRVLNSDGRGSTFKTANAILYAVAHGADVINLSLGSPARSALLREVLEIAADQGVVVVAAAGNLGTAAKQYPAAERCAIAVTSVNGERQRSTFANYGTWVGISAPGEGVYSAFPSNGYAWWSGTSMATPFVSGQVALLRSLDPALTPPELGRLIAGTTQPVDDANPTLAGQLGTGRTDLYASLQALESGTLPSPPRTLLANCQ